jgi:hypothetical protein
MKRKSVCHMIDKNNEEWFLDDPKKLIYHREDGPAVIYSVGYRGRPYKEEQWWYMGVRVKNCHSSEELKRLIKMKAFW